MLQKIKCPFCGAEISEIREYEVLNTCSCEAEYIIESRDDLYLIPEALAWKLGGEPDDYEGDNVEVKIISGYDLLLDDLEDPPEIGDPYDLVFIKVKR